MNSFALVLAGLILAKAPAGAPPCAWIGGPDVNKSMAVMVRDGHVHVVGDAMSWIEDSGGETVGIEARWDGYTALIEDEDRKASETWLRENSLLKRLSVAKGDLLWDGKRVDLGKVEVVEVYEAFPWQNGVLCRARVRPRRGFFERWPFKGSFMEPRDIEPYNVVFFDPTTLKGEEKYIGGGHGHRFFVYPPPFDGDRSGVKAR